MADVKKLAKYYKNCLYEEAKVSAFTNIENDDTTAVFLPKTPKLDENNKYIACVGPGAAATELTNLNIIANRDNKKQLIFGYMFLTGKLIDGTVLNTPLFYAPCELDRVNNEMAVSINSDTLSLNLPALVQLVPNTDEKDAIIEQLLDLKLQLPITNDMVDNIVKTLRNTVNILGSLVYLEDKEAVILTTVNKGLAVVISELNHISENFDTTGCSVLNKINCDPVNLPDLERRISLVKLDKSQAGALDSASTNCLTAVIGPAGTGKSSTIAGIASSFVMNGKSVLICSKQDSAVDVIYNKVRKLAYFPSAIRTGGKEYRKELAEIIDFVIKDVTINKGLNRASDESISIFNDKYSDYATYKFLCSERERLVKKADDIKKEYLGNTGALGRLFVNVTKLKPAERELDSVIEAVTEWHDTKIRDEQEFLNELISRGKSVYGSKTLDRLHKAVTASGTRRQLTLLAKALKKGNVESLGDTYDTIFKTIVRDVFPVWCTTTTDVSTSIPFIAGLFDVVIIDEASQCDIATCFPLLYRAKRAVVVGDDKQLKYLSFVPTAINNLNMRNAGIDPESVFVSNYREDSLFDFASYHADKVVMLTNQYRGCNSLMRFSNKKFYNNNIHNCGEEWSGYPLMKVYVGGDVAKDKTVNSKEVGRVINLVRDIVIADDGAENPRSIGILSPFKDQVKEINKAIDKTFTASEIERHKIHVGTAHQFQGEERDIMLISWVVSENSPIQQFTFINNPNLFNVAITRANRQVFNFFSTNNIPKGLLKEYLDTAELAPDNTLDTLK